MKLQAITAKICILLFLLPAAATIEAQKPPVKKAPPLKKVDKLDELEITTLRIPEIKDFAFVVEIDENAGVAVRVQKTEDSGLLADASSTKTITDFFKSLSPSPNGKASLDAVIVVKAAESLSFGKVLEVIRALRVSPEQKIKLQISENYYVGIPRLLTEEIVRPNPNYLLVSLQNDSKILLNREEHGTFNNTAPLKEKLDEIFKMRDKYGILRYGTNEVEKTVFVTAPDSVKFSDVIKLIREIAAAGAAPIGLQMDDFRIIQVIQ